MYRTVCTDEWSGKEGLHLYSAYLQLFTFTVVLLKNCCQGYLTPLTPPPFPYTHTPLQACNACPTLTGFEPPAGPRYRTRLCKSHYTWVTAFDSLIRDSKQRIRAYYNTGFAAFPPKIQPHHPLCCSHFLICFLSQIFAVLSSFISILLMKRPHVVPIR